MATFLSPTGLQAAQAVNTLNVLATYKERLCQRYSVNATSQPAVAVTYANGTPRLNGTTIFVPITASITITTPANACGCNPHVQTFTENYIVAFQGYAALPTAVTVTLLGRDAFGSCIDRCGLASAYTINDSLSVAITPAA